MDSTQKQNEARLLAILGNGARTSPELQQALGVSQPTVSRLLAALAGQIIILGRARATRYARPRAVRGIGSNFPLYKVTETGDVRPLGELSALMDGQYWWNPGDQPGELFDHLPWFVQDMRPEGFIGRAFAHSRGTELGLPERLTDWNDDHVLIALSHSGEDCMGNLILGENSVARYFQGTRQPSEPIPIDERDGIYPELVQTSLAGDPPGSSAGGEQPKFGALIEDKGDLRHVLVKFSPSIATASGRRWADLLVCEHIALQLIQEQGIAASQSELVEIEDRILLEVVRFDRCDRFGRHPMVSLQSVDNEFFGELDNWVAAAGRLENQGMLTVEDAGRLRWLALFGNLIANTDQHFGNISLIMEDGRRRFSLAPAYDMLPMLYRPQENEVPARTFNLPFPPAAALAQWEDAQQAAERFWTATASEQRISPEFRDICALNLEMVRGLRKGPRLIS